MTAISVVLPVFNAEKYVAEAVESILSQTWQDFELIIIDDGSTDQSLSILEEYQRRDERVVLISRANRGLVATLNEGLNRAKGRWIARMDADDISLPNRFERQLQWLENSGADICGTWAKCFGARDARVLAHPSSPEALEVALLFGSPLVHPTVMMRRELTRSLRYDSQWDSCEDYELWDRASNAGACITNVPEVLLFYRLHSSQISNKLHSRQLALAQEIRRRRWNRYLASIQIDEPLWVNNILNLREARPPAIAISSLEECFRTLLSKIQGEARATMFLGMTRLYLRAGTSGLPVVASWSRLNREFGTDSGLQTRATLTILGGFRMGPGDRRFDRLRRSYFSLVNDGR